MLLQRIINIFNGADEFFFLLIVFVIGIAADEVTDDVAFLVLKDLEVEASEIVVTLALLVDKAVLCLDVNILQAVTVLLDQFKLEYAVLFIEELLDHFSLLHTTLCDQQPEFGQLAGLLHKLRPCPILKHHQVFQQQIQFSELRQQFFCVLREFPAHFLDLSVVIVNLVHLILFERRRQDVFVLVFGIISMVLLLLNDFLQKVLVGKLGESVILMLVLAGVPPEERELNAHKQILLLSQQRMAIEGLPLHALGRVNREHPTQQSLQLLADFAVVERQFGILNRIMHLREVGNVRGPEGAPPSHHHMQNYSQRPDVDQKPVFLVGQNFGSHVTEGTQQSCRQIFVLLEHSSKAQVTYLEIASTAEDVGGFQIPVDDVVALELLEAARKLPYDHEGVLFLEDTVLFEVVLQVGPVAVLHHYVDLAGRLQPLHNSNHVIGVAQLHSSDLGLQQQPKFGPPLCVNVWDKLSDYLDCVDGLRVFLDRFVDFAKLATSDEVHQCVATDHCLQVIVLLEHIYS